LSSDTNLKYTTVYRGNGKNWHRNRIRHDKPTFSSEVLTNEAHGMKCCALEEDLLEY